MRVFIEDNKRWNVIILIYMSLGLMFIGNLFNFYFDVFYFYEFFYNLWRKVYKDEWNFFDDEINWVYIKDFFDLFCDCLGCGFLKNNILYRFIFLFVRGKKYFIYWWYFILEFIKEVVRDVCRGKKIIVVKVM